MSYDSGIIQKKNSKSGGYFYFRLTAVENSTSVANNTSNVTLTWKIWQSTTTTKWSMGNAYSSQFPQLNVYLGGNLVAQTKIGTFKMNSADESSAYTATYTTDIAHNSDGTGSISFYGEWVVFSGTSGATYGPASFTQTASMTLTTIARASKISSVSPTSQNIGSTVSISATIYDSSMTHKLQYSRDGGSTYTDISASPSFPYTWTIPDISSSIPNANSMTLVLRLITYYSGTQIGASTSSVTATIPSTYKPTHTLTLSEGNTSLSGLGLGYYVRGLSKLKGVFSASGSHSSTISSYYANTGSTTYASSTFTTGVMTASSYTVTSYVTDSRGKSSTTATATVSTTAYTAPSISVKAVRCQSDGTEDTMGAYFKATVTWSVTNITGNSYSAIKLYENGTQINTYTPSAYSGSYTFTTYPALATNTQATLYATISDTITGAVSGTTQSANFTVATAIIPLTLYDDKNGNVGVAFGGVASSGTVTSSLPIYDKGSNEIVGTQYLQYWDFNSLAGWPTTAGEAGEIEQIIFVLKTIKANYPNSTILPVNIRYASTGWTWAITGGFLTIGSGQYYGSFIAHSYGGSIHRIKCSADTWSYRNILESETSGVYVDKGSGYIVGTPTWSYTSLSPTPTDASISGQIKQIKDILEQHWGTYPLDGTTSYVPINIRIACYGYVWALNGFCAGTNYGSFIAQSYYSKVVYHIYKTGGTWYYEQLTFATATTIS